MTVLTDAEQANVRAALRHFKRRVGSWKNLSPALGFGKMTISLVASGNKPVSTKMAYCVARFAGVGVDAVLTGRFPPPVTCPHCKRGFVP